jgi:large subunit ribosomal protein L25
MKKHTMTGENRELTGRKIKHLRTQGLVPATIYGKKITSVNISIHQADFKKVYSETGESGLIELTIGKAVYPVLVNNRQIHPVSGEILHVEFHKVDLNEKVKTKVPVELIGEAPAVAQKVGALLQLIDELEVEALPTDLPEKLIVDVATLVALNDEVTVADIKVSPQVSILAEKTLAIVRVEALVSKQAEVEAAKDAAQAQAAKEASAETAAPAGDATAKTTEVAAASAKEEKK